MATLTSPSGELHSSATLPATTTLHWVLLPGSNLTTGSDNIDIGNAGVAGESSTIRIGHFPTQDSTFISGIRGVTTGNANAIPVMIDSDGQLGTMSSSRRFKHEIKPMDKGSEVILELKPGDFSLPER